GLEREHVFHETKCRFPVTGFEAKRSDAQARALCALLVGFVLFETLRQKLDQPDAQTPSLVQALEGREHRSVKGPKLRESLQVVDGAIGVAREILGRLRGLFQ